MNECGGGDQVKLTAYRQVFISASHEVGAKRHRYEQGQALAYLNTAAFKPNRRTHHRCLVRYNGARQATLYQFVQEILCKKVALDQPALHGLDSGLHP